MSRKLATVRGTLSAMMVILSIGSGRAQSLSQDAVAGAPELQGAIHGLVIDAASREPVSIVSVRIQELGRTELSHSDGTFHFDNLSAGTYTLMAQRLGFRPTETRVTVADGEIAEVTLELRASAIDIAGIVVTGTGSARSADDVYRPTSVLDDAELRRKLGSSVAATLAAEPGISQRYNGPAAAQPVIRGLSGDRVLVLEDGARTGDIASTSADHAVAIEPLTAKRIEVVRGPASLLYGSNALGGVINVIREEVPRTVPEAVTGMASAQVESVNRGFTAGATATVPAGPFAVRAELSGRTAGNTQTPLGELPTSQIDGYNAGIGASWVGAPGFAGAAIRDYWTRYGVPGSFNGELIPGGHEGGVEIELRRTAARVEAALNSGAGPFESVEFDGNFVRFDQSEYELGGPQGPVVGTQFRQFTGTANLIGRHRHDLTGRRSSGAVGFWILGKDFSTAGSRSGSRPAQELSVAGFVFEELNLNPFQLELGARYDWTRIQPLDTTPGEIGDVRTRTFGAFSGSAAALYRVTTGLTAGVSVARAFRTPSIEELFSNGPHLADFSFNIGNPDLNSEYGFGTDLFIRTSLPRLSSQFSIFRNAISDYIYYAPTGRLDPRFNRFPVYQAQQEDAILTGFDGSFQWEALRRVVVDGSASYVRASRTGNEGRQPLPAIPPLHGSLGARYDDTRYFAGLSLEAASAQTREGRFEQETDGYSLFHATAGYRWTAFDGLHSVTLQANNLLDATYRDHLSRIKAVAPQPGRNISLLYRVNF